MNSNLHHSNQTRVWSHEERLCYSLLRQTPKPPPPPHSLLLLHLQIQSFLLRRSLLFSNLHLLTLLISSLAAAASSSLRHARRLFDLRPEPDTFLCNSLIHAYTHHRKFHESFLLYRGLRKRHPPFSPDTFTFPFLLKSCCFLYTEGRQLHAHVIRMGFDAHSFTATGLVELYCKFGQMGCARKVFDGMTVRNAAVWNMMVVGCASVGDLGSAVGFFGAMPEKDTVAKNAMIDAFVKFGDVGSAWKLFDEMADKNVVSWTCLVSGYSDVGDMEAARALFDEMPVKNLYSWNAMIGGYCKNNQPHQALQLFRELQLNSYPFHPDAVTIVSVMPAVSSIGMIDLGRWIHRYARKNGLDKSPNVVSSLMDMYFKCGDIEEAKQIFNSIQIKETASWNTMINGLAVNGKAMEALSVFSDMSKSGSYPNEVTMLGVLSACAHGGLIEEGRMWFHKMGDLGIERRINHYGCMVDLLGKGGYLDEAERLIKEMPCGVNGIILSSLLFACVSCKDVRRAERVVRMAEKVEPGNVRNYVMLRNLYAEEKRWGDVERVKEMIRRFGGKKEAGCSVIEVGRRIWEFVAGDRAHPEWERISGAVGGLHLEMEGAREEMEWEFEMMG